MRKCNAGLAKDGTECASVRGNNGYNGPVVYRTRQWSTITDVGPLRICSPKGGWGRLRDSTNLCGVVQNDAFDHPIDDERVLNPALKVSGEHDIFSYATAFKHQH